MSRRSDRRAGRRTDPRRFGAAAKVVGPGGPRERDSVLVDATDAVLLESTMATVVSWVSNGVASDEPGVVLELGGRVNRSDDRVQVAFLMDEDGAAALVTELLALASRGGFGDRFMARVMERTERLHAKDAVRPVEEGR